MGSEIMKDWKGKGLDIVSGTGEQNSGIAHTYIGLCVHAYVCMCAHIFFSEPQSDLPVDIFFSNMMT